MFLLSNNPGSMLRCRQCTEICLYKAANLFSLTDLTSRHSGPLSPILQCLSHRPAEHLSVLNGGEPEWELVSKVMTSPSGSIALYERCGSEVFQTWARAGESLTPSLCSSCRVLKCKQSSDLATSSKLCHTSPLHLNCNVIQLSECWGPFIVK